MQGAERRRELGRFLRDRRSRLKPDDVGLPDIGRRRVVGLRREEVASLAGIGVTWYTMLESGAASGASSNILSNLARALRLDVDETSYLYRLADEREGSTPQGTVDPDLCGVLSAIEHVPAYIITSLWSVLAWNAAMTLVWNIEAPGAASFNMVRRTFTDPAMRAMHGERFEIFARGLVAMVRSGTSAWLEQAEYRQLCDEMRADAVFARVWDAYDIAAPVEASDIVVNSAAVGIFRYRAVTLDAPGDAGNWLVVQVPDDDSKRSLRQRCAPTGAKTACFFKHPLGQRVSSLPTRSHETPQAHQGSASSSRSRA